MAYATTFSTLKSELQNYLEDASPEYTSELDNIVARAQDRVQADLNLEIWHKTEASSLGAGSTLGRPSDCLKVIYLFFPSAATFAQKRSLAYCKAYGGSGSPKFYNDDTDATLFLAPANAATQDYELRYLAKLPALTDGEPSNWISVNAAELLFHAAVVESEQFLKDEEKVKEANATYAARLAVDIERFADLVHREYALPQMAVKKRR